jgi:hypothetical protein
MCTICRVCILHTNRNRFLHLSESETDKYLRQIITKFSRFCSLYHFQRNFISCTVSDRLISTVVCCRLLSKQAKLFCSFLKETWTKKMNRPDGRIELGNYTDKTINYTASNNELSQSSCSTKVVQVSVVACTDLLPNLWLEALSTNNKNLRQCIPCRGDHPRTSVAGTYQALPTQKIIKCNGELK